MKDSMFTSSTKVPVLNILLGLVAEGSNHWDLKVYSMTASLVSDNNLDLGWNTEADLCNSVHNNIDYLINQANAGCIPF